MILIDFDGQADCAWVVTAGATNNAAEPIANVRRVSFLIFLPLLFLVESRRPIE